MACFVPFNSRNLEICYLTFRPTVVCVEELVEVLKHFSLYTESLGCLYNSIFKSIHGNMIIWYGAWMKNKSNENKDLIIAALISMNVSTMAILTDHSYFQAYGGESKNGSPAATFCTGDTLSLTAIFQPNDQITEKDFSYACLAIFKSRFLKMEGAVAGVCLRSTHRPNVVSLYVWKSLQSCYAWILNSDSRKLFSPYYDGVSVDVKYDVFKVIYVSGDHVESLRFYTRLMIENDVQTAQEHNMVEDLESVA